MSMSRLDHLLPFVLILLLVAASTAQSTNVPLGHWLYDFVERFKVKGYIEDSLCGTKPFSRQEMAQAVAQIMDKVSEGAPISKTESFSESLRQNSPMNSPGLADRSLNRHGAICIAGGLTTISSSSIPYSSWA